MPWFKMGDVPNPLFDANGNPANGFILKAYDPETDNATSIAINADGDSLQASMTANAEGKWEVSSNEVIPHIDKKHKWGIFENATHAAANTPFYMGPFDNVEVKSSSTEHYLDSVSLMQNDASIAVGHVVVTKEFSTGNGGGGTYNVVLTSSVTPNGFNIIQGVADPLISFEWIATASVNIRVFNAIASNSDSRAAIQAAVDHPSVKEIFCDEPNVIVGDSGSTVTYRATTTKIGVDLPSNITVRCIGDGSFKVQDSSDAVAFVGNAKSNINLIDVKVEGNAANQPGSLQFGLYLYSCTDCYLDNVRVNESKDNTHEFILCSDIRIGSLYATNSNAGGSIGGGPQLEDCDNVTIESVIADTYDDCVAIIAHGGNTSDINIGLINGTSENSRAFFLGQSNTSAAQRNLTNITVEKVNSINCGSIGLTGACVISRGGLFDNIDVNIVDNGSYRAFELNPYDATFNGKVFNSSFTIHSLDADKRAINITHNDSVDTDIENCSLKAFVRNANSTDDASENDAIRIAAGDYWDIDVNIAYLLGKTNPGVGMVLGGSNTNDTVRYSQVSGLINGGDKNLLLNNADSNTLDGLTTRNSEEGNNINIDITAAALNTKLGNIIRDGEIQDDSTSTTRAITQLNRTNTQVSTSGTGEDDLATYALAADWMGKTGILKVNASGEITGTNGTKTIRFYFGASSLTLGVVAAGTTGDWHADINIYQNSTRTNQKVALQFWVNNALVDATYSDSFTTSTTSAVTIRFTGECADASDAVTQETMLIEGY